LLGFVPGWCLVVSLFAAVLVFAPGALAAGDVNRAGCPNEAMSGFSGTLPDCRAYELVSPVDKHGTEAGVEILAASAGQAAPDYSIASADGEGLLFGSAHEAITGALGETNAGVNYFWVSQRSTSGWSTNAALPPGNKERENDTEGAQVDLPTPILPSANLREFALETEDSFGAAPSSTKYNGYLIHEDGSVSWISEPVIGDPQPPLEETTGGPAVRIAGASPSLSTVFFAYPGTLVPEDNAKDPGVEDLSRSEVIAGKAHPDVGFYEWREGVLKSAAVLPNGTVDPYGAVPVATQSHGGFENLAADYDNNQVSDEGTRAFFVSPDPSAGAPASDPPELYERELGPDGTATTVLVTKSDITDLPAADPPLLVQGPKPENSPNGQTYAYASPDGTRVFFEDVDQLTAAAPNDASSKEYEFNTETDQLHYLPEVAGTGEHPESAVIAASRDGSVALFEKHTPGGIELDLWNGHLTNVSQLPNPAGRRFYIEPARATADGSAFVFETDSPLPGGFNNSGGFEQVYRYVVASGALECVSCPPASMVPSGDAHLSNDDGEPEVLDSRGVSADGERIFFDTPDPLVAQDVNGKRDVYEWEGGKVYLLSSGTSTNESFLLDNDENGDNVFFATTDSLVPADTDGGYDVYDARVEGGFPEVKPPSICTIECQQPGSAPAFGVPASAAPIAAGNLAPAPPGVAVPRTRKTAAEIRAERLQAALKKCESRSRRTRGKCEQTARKRYGPKRKATTKTKRKASK
jgi:hypothetical protein